MSNATASHGRAMRGIKIAAPFLFVTVFAFACSSTPDEAQNAESTESELGTKKPGDACTKGTQCATGRCSPVTRTCDACFHHGHACGATSECCGEGAYIDGVPNSSVCNPLGKCGVRIRKPGQTCESDVDFCEDGTCSNGVCRKNCHLDTDCRDPSKPHCYTHNNVCTALCNEDAHCAGAAEGQKCMTYSFAIYAIGLDSNGCGCDEDRNCVSGTRCDRSKNRCVTAECLQDSHCEASPKGRYCIRGNCGKCSNNDDCAASDDGSACSPGGNCYCDLANGSHDCRGGYKCVPQYAGAPSLGKCRW